MKTSTKHSRVGQLEWMTLCNEAFDIRTHTSESFLRNGSQRFSTRLSGRSHSTKVAVWREEENREMDIGAEGIGRWRSVSVGDFQGNSRTQAAVVL